MGFQPIRFSPRPPSPEIGNILSAISVMEAGPEFEYTEQELKLLAEMLIDNQEDPLKKINDLKLNE